MGTINQFTGIGRLTKDADLRFVAGSGMGILKFTIAIDRKMSKEKKREAEQQHKPTCDFIRCVLFGKSAEGVAQYMNKGILVAVNGAITTGSYEKDGQKVYTTDVNLNSYGGVEILEWNNEKKPAKTKEEEWTEVTDDSSDIPF